MRKIIFVIVFAVLVPITKIIVPALFKLRGKKHPFLPSKTQIIFTALTGMVSALSRLFYQEAKHSLWQFKRS